MSEFSEAPALGKSMRVKSVRPKSSSPLSPWRLVMALAVVAAVAAALWLWGRPASVTTNAVVLTSELWTAGAQVGKFQLIPLPHDLADRFVQPQELVGKVAATDIPAGVYLSPALLAEDGSVPNEESTLMRFSADFSSWPDQPLAGEWAVIATQQAGCALEVMRLAGASESSVVLEVDPALSEEFAAVTQHQPLVLWKSPKAGWPACDGGHVAPETVDPEVPES